MARPLFKIIHLPATNFKPSRLKIISPNGDVSITRSKSFAMEPHQQMLKMATDLAMKIGWRVEKIELFWFKNEYYASI